MPEPPARFPPLPTTEVMPAPSPTPRPESSSGLSCEPAPDANDETADPMDVDGAETPSDASSPVKVVRKSSLTFAVSAPCA